MRIPPKVTYKGLTILLSNPSRFDIQQKKLLSGYVGDWFNLNCLQPRANKYQCDIRTLDSLASAPLLDNTKVILLCCSNSQEGIDCLRGFTNSNHSIHNTRGHVYPYKDIVVIPTYFPQDCMDMQDYEKSFNDKHSTQSTDEDANEDDKRETGDKDRAKTARENWKFWFMQDTRKALRLLLDHNGKVPSEPSYETIVYPSLDSLEHILSNHYDEILYLDIETDFDKQMYCIGFNFSSSDTVYVVPFMRSDYSLAYPSMGRVARAFVRAFNSNTLVFHNGFGFDLLILAWKYNLLFGRSIYDTMIAQHRCVVGETLIDTVSGKVKIKDLVGKTNFYVWSIKSDKPFPAKVTRCFSTGCNKLVRVKLWRRKFGGTELFNIDCTSDHKFMTLTGDWIEAKDLSAGTKLKRIRRDKEKNCRVVSVECLDTEQETFCMDVEDTHCFSANGVIVHNCFPEVEKSLAHCISMWTWMPFHKDEFVIPQNHVQEQQLWYYNAKDVWTMRLIRERQLEYAKTVPGLSESIECGCAQIRPYLINTLTGIRYDEARRQIVTAENDRLMTQYLRMIRILVGAEILPTSNKQCVNYFHNQLGYAVVSRSKKTKLPSLDEKAMQRLKLKVMNNPVIDLCLAYRARAKETGTLGFLPWIQPTQPNV